MRPTKESGIVAEVVDEVYRQHEKWGEQNHPDGTDARNQHEALLATRRCNRRHQAGTLTWTDILTEEFWEALAEEDPARLRMELVQVAAVCVNWVEALDRRQRPCACGLSFTPQQCAGMC